MTTATAPPAPPAPPPLSPAPTDRAEPQRSPARTNVQAVLLVLGLILVFAVLAPMIGGMEAFGTALSIPFVYLLIREPVLRRLAIRNSTRRPRETALIILGALLGTAIITSSYVVGDTLTSSIHRSAYTQLGPIDEVVLASGPASGQRVAGAIDGAHITGIDGTLRLQVLQAAVASGGSVTEAEPQAQLVETDFAQARSFGGHPSATGISGPTPTGDNAAIGTDLAQEIGVKVGDRATVYAYGGTRTFQVDRILPRLGVAGLASFANPGATSADLFVPIGTLAQLQQAGPLGARSPPPLSVFAVSNLGNVTGGAHLTSSVHNQLVAALRGVPSEVQDVKQNLITIADTAGKGFSQLFQTFGYFSVAVGVLLLINIFVMLAQERKQTLGMLRAVGLRRASLVGSFSIEGWLYSVASAVAGMLVGIGIGRLVITAASRIFNQAGGRRGSLSLHFAVTAHSLEAGFSFGFVVALLTVVITSCYVARLNVIRAIRDLPEPPHDGRRTSVLVFGVLFTGVGLILTIVGVAASAAVPALLGPALLGSGLALLSLGRLPIRPTVTIISTAVIVWSVAVFGILSDAFQNAGITVFFIQGVILNVFAVLLVTFNQSTIGGGIRAIGGGARNMSLRLGLAYPLAKRFRTGLLLAMYAIIVFVLVLLTTISQFFSGQITEQIQKIGGGAAIIVDSNAAEPVPVGGVQALSTKITAIAATSEVLSEFRLGSTGTFSDFTAVGFDGSFVGHGSPDLHAWSQQYATQADVYRAVATDPTKIIVGVDLGGSRFGPGGGAAAPGDSVTMRDAVTGQTAKLTVVGVVSTSFYDDADHVFVSRTLSDTMFGDRSSSDLLFVSTAPGTDNDALAAAINGHYVANGASATSFNTLVHNQFSIQDQFLTLIRGYVALGLLVGIAGLGVVMVRSVRERRREVGVLRALGFSSVAVRRAFLAESSFIALEGILIGAALALITAWRLVNSGSFGSGAAFTVPWASLGILVVVTYIASLLATAAPAIQASRIRPAVALRITD